MTSQIARDLRWVVESPSLIDIPIRSVPVRRLSAPKGLLEDGELHAVAENLPSHRVGRYFEQLILHWLSAIRRCDEIRYGVQVKDKNRTLGEIDFMFTDESGIRTHWETAVKFYLHFPQANSSGSHFIGPNAADNFEKKMRRMLGHQLSMSERLPEVPLLPEVTLREPFVKGRIFYHPDFDPPESLPTHLSRDHLRNTWIRRSELDWLSDTGADHKFCVLRKPYWLADDVRELADPDVQSAASMKDHLVDHSRETNRPVLISRLEQNENHFSEIDRMFVVSDHWPENPT